MLDTREQLLEAEEFMKAAIEYLDETLARIRAGKANVHILDGIRIDYYGSMVPLSNVATITTPDAKTIAIQPWEKALIPVLEKAIQNSDVGITPANNGEIIRLGIPPLTEDRRRQLAKQARGEGEEAKISIRNARREVIEALKKMGMHFVAYGPDELIQGADQEILKKVEAVCRETGAVIEMTSDPACLKGADVLYTDIWASMGEEEQIPERVRMLTPFKVTMEMLEATGNPDVRFMHCLPAFHDFETKMAKEQLALGYDIREVTDEVFRSSHSVVFDEAENRLHTIKAVMVATLGEKNIAL